MKAFSLALLAIVCAMAFVGCDDKHTVYVDVPDPVVTNTFLTTPGGLTVVEIEDPNGLLAANPGLQAQIFADLDYQVLYIWANEESTEFTVDQLKALVKQVLFHLIVDSRFKVNQDRNVHYAQIGVDIFLATEHLDKQGHRCADADRAMDLFSGDVNEGHDVQVTTYPAGQYPASTTFPGGYLTLP